MRVRQFSQSSQVLLLPLGIPLLLVPACSTQSLSQDSKVWRVLATTDVGNVTQGHGVLDHQVFPISTLGGGGGVTIFGVLVNWDSDFVFVFLVIKNGATFCKQQTVVCAFKNHEGAFLLHRYNQTFKTVPAIFCVLLPCFSCAMERKRKLFGVAGSMDYVCVSGGLVHLGGVLVQFGGGPSSFRFFVLLEEGGAISEVFLCLGLCWALGPGIEARARRHCRCQFMLGKANHTLEGDWPFF